ncbi:MAG: hypothetical protein EHM20_05965 [Alphaproteobacteria bacterium]|nr:MAG: hypothetical protein EHM20_05965 [Alphaproteobacteria bacterium]
MIVEKTSKIFFVDSIKGLFINSPLVSISLLISLVSLVGMPWTLGFPVMQSLFSEFTIYVPQYIIFLIFSQTIVSITIIRWVFAAIKEEEDDTASDNLKVPEKLFLLICVSSLITLGIFPNIVYTHISDIVNDLQFLVK